MRNYTYWIFYNGANVGCLGLSYNCSQDFSRLGGEGLLFRKGREIRGPRTTPDYATKAVEALERSGIMITRKMKWGAR